MSDRRSRITLNLAVGLVFLGAGMLALSAVTAATAGSAQAASTQATSQPLHEPTSIPGAVAQAATGWELLAGGKYREGVAILVMLLVWVWRRYASVVLIGKLSPWGVGFATVAVAFVATLPGALLAGSFSWGRFIWESVLTSAEAMLFWQMIMKRITWFHLKG